MDSTVLPIITALLAALATLGGAYLTFKSQVEKVRIDAQREAQRLLTDAEASKRDDDRDDVQALWKENRELRREIANQAEESRLALAAQARTYQVKIDDLSGRVTRLESESATRLSIIQGAEERDRALIKSRCPVWRTLPCPRLVELHDPDVLPTEAREIVGREGEM